MCDIKKVRNNLKVRKNASDIEILEALDIIKYNLQEYENEKMSSLINELKNEILKERRDIRSIDSLIELWKEEERIELNEVEFEMLTEYLILHDTGYRLIEVNSDYEHYVVGR